MSNEFSRGKIFITATIGAIIMINGIGIWFNNNRLLKWSAELAQTVPDRTTRDALAMLQSWFIINQEGVFANQWLNYSAIIFLCLLLYVGYNWSRWIWAIYWLTSGAIGIFFSTYMLTYLGYLDRLIAVGYSISIIYVLCGTVMVMSRSVHTYIFAMRSPAHGLRRM